MGYIATNVRHKEINEYYRNYDGPKVKYNTFKGRIQRYGYTDREKAITEIKYTLRRKNKGIDEDGRICNKCKERKPREKFAYTKSNKCGMTSYCKDCRNKAHRELREKQGYSVDKAYKEKTRKLEIGGKIALYKERYIDGIPREDIYEVVDYKYKKGYLLKSMIDGIYTRIDTGSNPKSKKFYKIDIQ